MFKWGKFKALKAVPQYLGIDDKPLSLEQQQVFNQRVSSQMASRLDAAIVFECHILEQTAGSRVTSHQLEGNSSFRTTRPDWRPYPDAVWQRELLAAKRLSKALGMRHGV